MSGETERHAAQINLLWGLVSLARQDSFAELKLKPEKKYAPVRRPCNFDAVRKHLNNEAPIGIYPVIGDKTRLAVIDVDDHDGETSWEEMQQLVAPLLREIAKAGLKVLLCRSGGGHGLHIWFCWQQVQPCHLVRNYIGMIVQAAGLRNGTSGIKDDTVEIFPKQDEVTEGQLGNLIALPFARKSVPLDDELNPLSLDEILLPPLEDFFNKAVPKSAADKPSRIEGEPSPYGNERLEGDEKEVSAALQHIPADDYDIWIKIGLALKAAFGDAGFAIFDQWSSQSAKYDGNADTQKRWEALTPNGAVGIGTIFYLAQQNGWNGPPNPEIRKMNAQYGILTKGNKTQIIEKQVSPDDPDVWRALGKGPFKDRLRAKKIPVPNGNGGNDMLPVADYWLVHKYASHYQRVDFDPSAQPGDNGTVWNIWQGFAVEPAEGSWDKLKAHIRDNICQGDDVLYNWLLNWMALGVQKPADPIGTAPVLMGKPGTGKSLLANIYGKLWGKHYVSITHESHVTGRFNAHLFGKRFVFIDEGMFGGDKKAAGVIKTRVTEPYITFEQKGIDPIYIKNRLIFFVASNMIFVVPADLDDRRWQMIAVGNGQMKNRAYFAAIYEEMENGGYEAMLYELMHRDITQGPDPRVTIKNDDLLDQIVQAMRPELQFLYALLDEGTLPQSGKGMNPQGATTIAALYDMLSTKLPRAAHIPAQAVFAKTIKKVIPSVRTAANGKYWPTGVNSSQPQRSTRYEFPPLAQSRAEFEDHIGQPIKWTNVNGEWAGGPEDSDAPF